MDKPDKSARAAFRKPGFCLMMPNNRSGPVTGPVTGPFTGPFTGPLYLLDPSAAPSLASSFFEILRTVTFTALPSRCIRGPPSHARRTRAWRSVCQGPISPRRACRRTPRLWPCCDNGNNQRSVHYPFRSLIDYESLLYKAAFFRRSSIPHCAKDMVELARFRRAWAKPR